MKQISSFTDESGQDVVSEWFTCATIVIKDNTELNEVRAILRDIEYKSGKGQGKWSKAKRARKESYIKEVISKLSNTFTAFHSTTKKPCDIQALTIATICRAIAKTRPNINTHVDAWIDGLDTTTQDRYLQIAKKQHGLKNTQFRKTHHHTDEITRLADAFASMLREAKLNHINSIKIIKTLEQKGLLAEI